jgi:hypothetical protein
MNPTATAAKNDLTGISWGPHAVDDNVAPVATSDAPAMEQKPASPLPAKPVVPIGKLLQPGNQAVARPVETKPAEAIPPAETPVAKRLKALQQLLDQKLIDESEYKQQKLRILNDL